MYGALGRIRTFDRSVRSRVLYPAELRVQIFKRILFLSSFLFSLFSISEESQFAFNLLIRQSRAFSKGVNCPVFTFSSQFQSRIFL
jgi:hypothetical protein